MEECIQIAPDFAPPYLKLAERELYTKVDGSKSDEQEFIKKCNKVLELEDAKSPLAKKAIKLLNKFLQRVEERYIEINNWLKKTYGRELTADERNKLAKFREDFETEQKRQPIIEEEQEFLKKLISNPDTGQKEPEPSQSPSAK